MCTQPRMVVPFAFYQVTSKSICDQKIFPDNTFKTFFLKSYLFSQKLLSMPRLVIMDDHFYMVVKSSDISISKFMQRLNSVYAKYFNRTINAKDTSLNKGLPPLSFRRIKV